MNFGTKQVDLEKSHNEFVRKEKLIKNEGKLNNILVNQAQMGPIKPENVYYSSSDEEEEKIENQTNLGLQEVSESIKNEEKNKEENEEEEERNSNFEEKDIIDKNLPLSHEVLLKGHNKTITSMAIDSAGTRLVTGSNDYIMRLWDFQGMNKNMYSFRVVEPIPNHPITSLSFSSNNSEILVIAGNSQPKILNREGKELAECIKGDMYIKDMTKTKGHVSMVYDGRFHPVEKNTFMSCSLDGTIRVWDRNQRLVGIEQQIAHKEVIKCRDNRGLKVAINTANYSHDGSLIFSICEDGSIQGFGRKSFHSRPDFYVLNGHSSKMQGTKVGFFKDCRRIVTRALDHTMKIWDIRNFKKPVHVWYNLPNYLPGSKLEISPDEQFIITGTSIGKIPEEKHAKLLFYDSNTFELNSSINIGQFSCTNILWHSELNQIFYGIK